MKTKVKSNGKTKPTAAFSAGRATRDATAKAVRVTVGSVAQFLRGAFTSGK